jgi:O-methyltransferase domain/Dimerisation domain
MDRDVLPNAQATVLEMIFGRWRSQTLYAGVKLGIFDALGAGPRTAAAVADELGLDPALAYRLMRGLASLELLSEDCGRNFTLAETGELLRRDHPQTLRGVTLLEEGPEHYALWRHLPAMVREGTQNAFVREFKRMAFEHAAHEPAYGEVFNEAMTSYSSAQTAWTLEALADYDFSGIEHVCDIGGGHGHLLASLVAKYPTLHGTVLELPSVIEDGSRLYAPKLGVGERCRYVAGDMFKGVPQADAYVMKMILHDWNDEECGRILRSVAQAANVGARLFIVEHIIPHADTPHFAKLFDLHMMCWGTGRERTVEEFAEIVQSAGWRYRRTWYPRARIMGVVEASL